MFAIPGINFIDCQTIDCDCSKNMCDDISDDCDYRTMGCECDYCEENQSIDDIIHEISKYNPKLYYKDISKQKQYKQIKLISKKNENTVLITNNKNIIDTALDASSIKKKHMMVHNNRCLMFDNSIKDNTAIRRFLTGNLKENECGICYNEIEISISLNCCGYIVCKKCIGKIIKCPVCKYDLTN